MVWYSMVLPVHKTYTLSMPLPMPAWRVATWRPSSSSSIEVLLFYPLSLDLACLIHHQIQTMLLIDRRMLLLLLITLLASTERLQCTNAFVTMSTLATTQRCSPIIASTVENIFETPQEMIQDDDLMSIDSTITPRTQRQSIQLLWSFDKDAIINVSIFIVAIAIVVTSVLSVDVGITRGWSAEEIALRIPLDNWRSYTNILSMAPIQTKAITSATVYTIGDIISQKTEGVDIGKLDRGRILRSAIAGLIGHGPMSHVWYHVSEDFFDNILGLHAWWDFIPKVVVDQLVFGPIWNNSYILLLGVMQLQRPGRIFADMKRSTIPLMISGLKLWPFVHCITYGLIPVENRLLWVDLVEIVWVTILANQANSEVKAGDDTDR